MLGVDTGSFGRHGQGRSDSMMVAGISPEKMNLVSILRDTLVQIAGHSGNSKLNATYAYGGVSGSLNTLQNYLDMPLDRYIEINFGWLRDLSKVIGPVKVNNDLEFTHLDHHFNKGKVTVNADDNILSFTGMRKESHVVITVASCDNVRF